jgi:hypothetical protein
MKFTKQHLCDLPFCYAVSHIKIDGRIKILLAPDAYGPCYSIDSETFEREVVWQGPGGTMSMIALPGRNGDFLAVQRFNPGFEGQDAEIVYVRRRNDKWQSDVLFKLPYVHRFDILERNGVSYIICCTVCSKKKNVEDWSSPGTIYVAELPSDFSKPIHLIPIRDGMTRNHGYCRIENTGYASALTSCDQGVFEVSPPPEKGGTWEIHKILDEPVSDIAVCDIDGDGVKELAVIAPFHGNDFVVYRKTEGSYIRMYRYPGEFDFGHVVWGGTLRGEAVFIGGCREKDRELFLLQWKNGAIHAKIIEEGAGPSNVLVLPHEDGDLLVVANREISEGALYLVQES